MNDWKIPEYLKENCSFEISPFGKPVLVNYQFYWPEKRSPERSDPLISFIEFRAEPGPISETGYHSYFFHNRILSDQNYASIEAFALAVAVHLAKENGYQTPQPGNQLSLF